MRTVTFPLLAVLGLCGVNTARAADLDYDYLRGADYDPVPAPVVDWSGVYVGGHGGFTSTSLGFGNTAQPIVANDLRQTSVESQYHVSTLMSSNANRRVNGTSFGAFVGYNIQFDEIVLGIEADYTHFGSGGAVTDTIGRQMVTNDGFVNYVNLASSSRTKLNDYATLRARAGYAFGNILPFVTGGFAIGSAQIADHVSVQVAGYDQTTYRANQAITDATKPAFVGRYGYSSFDASNPNAGILSDPLVFNRAKTKIVGGFSAGTGVDYAITPNILLRAEYQYVLFDAFDGHKVNLNTVRAGAAVKF
ncbi:outer membrane beta-barrel protein [Methylobacterium sp. NMS14P]|nr:outer membrane beta-barrel protein [Methylobacterium sp. NMS14P]WCS28279.1 outer membrane beta-barrel protein [Methylobacterium sp. NMS14P]